MYRVIGAIIAVCVVGGCGSDDSNARVPTVCERIRDHLVELRISSAGKLSERDLAQHRLALTEAMGDRFLGDCAKSISDTQASCLLAASDEQAASSCTSSAN